MEFNQVVLEQVAPILFSYGFIIVEERKDYIRFESIYLVIVTTHDQKERSEDLWIGRKGLYPVIIDHKIIEQFFPEVQSKFISTKNRYEDYGHNIKVLFEGGGRRLLEGDLFLMTAIHEFSNKEAKAYTDELVRRQNLKSADQAWEKQDYEEFLKQLEILDTGTLPGSYKLKQDIAIKRLNK